MSAFLFRRYVWLLDKISEASRSGGISFDEISRKWEYDTLNDRPGEPLAKRTFNNHIQAIGEAFGIDIVCRRQGGYNYVIESDDDSQTGDMKNMLLNYLLASNIQLSQINSPYMILPKINLSANISCINPTFKAISDQRKIKILWTWKYRSHTEDRWIELEPYYIKGYTRVNSEEGVQWFVYGKGVNMGSLQVYNIDKIKEVVVLDEPFSRPADTIEQIERKTLSLTLDKKEDDDSFEALLYCDLEQSRSAYKFY